MTQYLDLLKKILHGYKSIDVLKGVLHMLYLHSRNTRTLCLT